MQMKNIFEYEMEMVKKEEESHKSDSVKLTLRFM